MELAQIDFNEIQKKAFPDVFIFKYSPTIGDLISFVLPYIFTLAGILLLVYLVFGGFQYMLSRGDPKAAGAAKSHITNALIGFIIVFIAFWVVQLFGRVLGLQSILDIFGAQGGKQ